MCSTDADLDNYTSREDLKTTVTKALEHNVRTSDGMNWNLHDLVYEAALASGGLLSHLHFSTPAMTTCC